MDKTEGILSCWYPEVIHVKKSFCLVMKSWQHSHLSSHGRASNLVSVADCVCRKNILPGPSLFYIDFHGYRILSSRTASEQKSAGLWCSHMPMRLLQAMFFFSYMQPRKVLSGRGKRTNKYNIIIKKKFNMFKKTFLTRRKHHIR